MAKKKQAPPAKAKGSRRRKPGPIRDRRSIEKFHADIGRLLETQDFKSEEEANAFLQQFVGRDVPIPCPRELTPLEQAQEVMYEAFEASGKRRVTLARKALEVSPDCADAYVLLAEEWADSLPEAMHLYRQGVEAGERALGPQAFEEDVGNFWGILGTRPYMRARAGLAQCLWASGQRQAAVQHLTEMLRLNPNDNQGVRYPLATWLLTEGADDALGRLLKQYEGDVSATWLYTKALWVFRREGVGRKANAALRKAFEFLSLIHI